MFNVKQFLGGIKMHFNEKVKAFNYQTCNFEVVSTYAVKIGDHFVI